MQLELLLITILPLVLFVFVEIKYGIKAGIWTAIIVAILALFYFYFKTQTWDSLALTEIGLILVLGFISLKMKTDRWIKLQPVATSIILVLYLLFLQFFSEPLLIKMLPALQMMSQEMSSASSINPMDILTEDLLRRISLHLVPLIAAHGLLVFWGAYRLSSFGWLITRLAVYPMLLVFLILEMAVR